MSNSFSSANRISTASMESMPSCWNSLSMVTVSRGMRLEVAITFSTRWISSSDIEVGLPFRICSPGPAAWEPGAGRPPRSRRYPASREARVRREGRGWRRLTQLPPCARPPHLPSDSNHSRLRSTSRRSVAVVCCARAQPEPAHTEGSAEPGRPHAGVRSMASCARRSSPSMPRGERETNTDGCSCDCRSRGRAPPPARAIAGSRSTLAPH